MKTNGGNAGSRRALSYACAYVPEEIIVAAGLVPERAVPENRPSDADAHIHPNSCFFVKSLLAAALDGAFSNAAGFIFTDSCDAMRRLRDICTRYVEDTRPLFIDVPRKQDPDSIDFFASELRALVGALEREFPGSRVTDEDLERAIKTCNRIRRQMGQVFELQRGVKPGVRGMDVVDLILESARTGPAEFSHKLERFLSGVGEGRPVQKGRRIVLSGSVINRADLVGLIEDAGGQVVALDSCFGARHYDLLVEEDSPDPIRALAKRYLSRPPCPRMDGFETRFEYLKRLIDVCRADGLIYSAVKFCDSHRYDVPMLAEGFKTAGVPFLFIENDYEWTGLDQIRTRVEAFLEMIGEGGG
jgi:benzoyl-CoA reductase/2-hydroxyglutaryl-CoA dehydratase subunit BcrC/BadD/HgdB